MHGVTDGSQTNETTHKWMDHKQLVDVGGLDGTLVGLWNRQSLI